jgi:hypothetical protein
VVPPILNEWPEMWGRPLDDHSPLQIFINRSLSIMSSVPLERERYSQRRREFGSVAR